MLRRSLAGALSLGCAPPVPGAGAGQAAVAAPAPWEILEHSALVPPDGAASRFDPSGIIRIRDGLYVLSDKPEWRGLARLGAPAGGGRALELLPAPAGPWPADGEGLADCGDHILIADEAGALWVQRPGQPLERAPLALPPGAAAWGNAGIEGVACAPDGRRWVAKERDPPGIWALDGRAARPLAVPRGAVSDLHFSGGRLWALAREDRALLELDPDSGEERARRPLPLDEARWTTTHDRFGMAEGLLVEGDEVWLVLDVNEHGLRAEGGAPWGLLLHLRWAP